VRIHPGNFECFMEEYEKQLRLSHDTEPQNYAWDISQMNEVVARMRVAIEKGSFNKDSSAFRRTCRKLGIKHTYKAISEFIS